MREKIYIKTFGCRTNIYDSELIKRYIKDYDIVNDEKLANIIIINSCTVTNGADIGVKSYINSLKDKKIILTGCGAISKGKNLYKNGKIHGVLGASNKSKINDLLKSNSKFYELGNLNYIDKDIVSDYENHTKAFIKIQEGCDFACSYCIIPSVRGKSRSVDEKDIIKQVEILANNGYSEIVLTGTNIGSYGIKNNTTLGKLLQKIGIIKGIKRIRLGSLEPAQLDESFFEILDESWLERHLHIALQHTNEKMLRIMRRRSHSKDDIRLFNFLSDKNFALGTDFIVGHPGESEEIWKDALSNFKNYNITHIHAFIFSPRENTHSASLKDTIEKSVAKERLKILTNLVKENNFNFRKKQKKSLQVLVENKKNNAFEGYDQYFNKIKIYSNEDLAKQWIDIMDYEINEEFNEAFLKD